MRGVWSLVLWLSACSMPSGGPVPDDQGMSVTEPDWAWVDSGRSAAPGELALSLQGGVIGETLRVHVDGALSFDGIWVLQTSGGEGEGVCSGYLGGACIGLLPPVTLSGRAWMDITGVGMLELPVPDEAALEGSEVCFQGVIRRGPGGANSEVTETVCAVFGYDADGDGVPDGMDACPGSDDGSDGDGDGVADGCDPCPTDPLDVDSDGDAVCDVDDVCDGSDDGADEDGDGVPDGCDSCLGDPTNTCDPPCQSMPYVELLSGDVPVPTDCAPGDYECQSKAVCEFVSGMECIRQDYDCTGGNHGSYYPVGTPGGSNFNFAINYDFSPAGNVVEEGGTYGGYGNICCSPFSYCNNNDVRRDHSGAGYGHWGLDADGADCL